jgi:hypothetical protein
VAGRLSAARKINFKAGAPPAAAAPSPASTIALVFGFRHQPLVERMNSGEGGAYLQALREAVQKVLGASYEVRCVYDPQASSPRSTGGGGHLVQAARELGARVVRGVDEGEAT